MELKVILSNFAERLTELINERELKQNELAEQTGLEEASICRYLKGNCLPTVNALVVLADYFNCSTDFLLGYKDESNEKSFLQCSSLVTRLKQIINKNGYSIYGFAKIAHMPNSCFYDWKNGKRSPSLESVIKIAEFFDLSIDYVLGREV